MSTASQRKTAAANKAAPTTQTHALTNPDPALLSLYENARLLQQADRTLKMAIAKIKVQDQKVECAEAFDPLLQMAKNMRKDIENKVDHPMMHSMLSDMLSACGDSRCLEGWTWTEIKEKNVRACVPQCCACLTPLPISRRLDTSSSASATSSPCVNSLAYVAPIPNAAIFRIMPHLIATARSKRVATT